MEETDVDGRTARAGDPTVYARALDAAGVPSEVHLFARGGHAFGLRRMDPAVVSQWPGLLATWLHGIGVLERGAGRPARNAASAPRAPLQWRVMTPRAVRSLRSPLPASLRRPTGEHAHGFPPGSARIQRAARHQRP